MSSSDGCEKVKFPYEVTSIDAETNAQILRDFRGKREGFVQVGPKKYCFMRPYAKHAEEFYNFQARSDDVWIVTFPRSGTTLTQELIWLISNDFDFERAKNIPLTERFPFFESCLVADDKWKEEIFNPNSEDLDEINFFEELCMPVHEILANTKSPRFIKSHSPMSLLPPSVMNVKAKIVYVARHPKDVAVSLYHLFKLMRANDFVNDFETFWNYFENNLIPRTPFWDHVEEGWQHRNEPNVLFLFYEELNKDMPAAIRKLATFLNKEINDDQMSQLVDHMRFEKFRKNPSVNSEDKLDISQGSFIRRGKVSGNEWQQEYTPELITRAKNWFEKNSQRTAIKFPDYKD